MKRTQAENVAASNQENTMNITIKSTAIAMAVAGLFAAQPATAADNLTFGGFSTGLVSATLYTTPTAPVGGNPTSVSAGGLNMTNTTAGGTFQAWCVDIYSWLATLTTYTNVSGASFYGTTTTGLRQVSDLDALATRPEPDTYAMLLAGLGLIGFVVRHRKQEEAV